MSHLNHSTIKTNVSFHKFRFSPFFIPGKSFESGYSPRKFIPAKFFIRRLPRKFIPAKCKYFAVFLPVKVSSFKVLSIHGMFTFTVHIMFLLLFLDNSTRHKLEVKTDRNPSLLSRFSGKCMVNWYDTMRHDRYDRWWKYKQLKDLLFNWLCGDNLPSIFCFLGVAYAMCSRYLRYRTNATWKDFSSFFRSNVTWYDQVSVTTRCTSVHIVLCNYTLHFCAHCLV